MWVAVGGGAKWLEENRFVKVEAQSKYFVQREIHNDSVVPRI